MGWTETLSAAGGLIFSGSIGLLHYLKSDKNITLDLVPCDFVSNTIIASTVQTAQS